MKYLVKTTIKTNYTGEYQYRVFEQAYDRQVCIDNVRYALCKLADEPGTFVVYPKSKLFTPLDDIHDNEINNGLNYIGNGKYLIAYNLITNKYLVYNKTDYNFKEVSANDIAERTKSDLSIPNLILDIEVRMDKNIGLRCI